MNPRPAIRALVLLSFATQVCLGQFALVSLGRDTNFPGGFARSVVISGSHAYVLGSALSTVDITDPTNPVTLTSTNLQGDRAAIAGNYLYAEANAGGLRTFDISNPENPVNVGFTNNNFAALAIAASSNRVCLFGNYSGMRIYDAAEPSKPINAGLTNTGPYGYGGAVSGNYAYFAGMFISGGMYNILRIYDISNPANPVLASAIRYTNGSYANDMALLGNYAYLAGGSNATYCFWICNVSDPTNPFTVTRVDPGLYANRIIVSGNYAYLLAGTRLRIFDVSNPSQPVFAGQSILGPQASDDLAVAGNFVYLPNYGQGLRIFLLTPQLSITTAQPNEVRLSWSAPPAPGWSLQQSPTLTLPNWVDATNTPVLVGNRMQVLLSGADAQQFYRLKYQ